MHVLSNARICLFNPFDMSYTGCTANGSVGMIEIRISHPDESVCCQVFDATD